MNVVSIIGRISTDLEVKSTQSGKLFVNFNVAVNEYSNGENKAVFIPCVAWEKIASTLNGHCRKGSQIGLEGKLIVNSFQDKNGNKRNDLKMLVNKLHFIGSRNQSTQEQYAGDWQTNEEASVDVDETPTYINSDDLPF